MRLFKIYDPRSESISLIQKHFQGRFQIFIIDGNKVDSAENLFKVVRDSFPLDPLLTDSVNWDALIDSVRGGLTDCVATNIALLWINSNNMRINDPKRFELAVECLTGVLEDIENYKKSLDEYCCTLLLLTDEKEYSEYDISILESL